MNPKQTAIQRMGLYIWTMYPPIPSLLISILSFYNLYFLLTLLRGYFPLQITPASLGGALTLFFFLLFLRISDELKDYESDKLLFPERLVPSGKVLLSDLYWLMGLSITMMLGLNLFFTGALVAFLLLFGYGLLMLKYFFLRRYISGSLLLALVTHNPSVLFMNFYVMAIFASDYQETIWHPDAIYLIILFWLPGLAWELSRKIKAPQDENAYETYSRIFGYRLATLIPMFILALHYFMLVRLFVQIGFSPLFLISLSLILIIVLLIFGRFILQPTSDHARLKPFTEAYMLISALGLFLDFILRNELLWTVLNS